MTDQHQIEIETFCLGPYQTNCYIVRSSRPDGSEACWVSDVSFNSGPLFARLGELGLTPEAFVLTHAHVDHIAGLFDAKKRFPDTPIWIHEAEELWLLDAERNLSALSPMPMTAPPADRLFVDGEELE
ncbi:MAG: MBL fold metallo-hydrolase, partial [Phycisphaerales bacterium]|nr:MBL fold metallo-hydrolase [Phycisphaerales bacterium]